MIFISTVPPWQAPDEPLHYDYMHFLATEKKLPILGKTAMCGLTVNSLRGYYFRDFVTSSQSPYKLRDKVSSPTDYKGKTKHDYATGKYTSIILSAFMGKGLRPNHIVQHSPLYYAIGGFVQITFLRFFGMTAQIWLLRFLSIIFGLFSLYFVYLSSKILFEKNPYLQYAMVAFVALQPMFGYINSAINNDPLTILLSSIFLYLLIDVIKNGLDKKKIYMVAVVFALGMLTKASFGIGIFGIIFVLIFSKKENLKITDYLIPAGLSLFIFGIWYVRLYILYGSILPRIEFYKPDPSSQWRDASIVSFIYKSEFLGNIFRSFWGNFGWLRIQYADYIYDFIKYSSLVTIIGLVIDAVLRFFRKFSWEENKLFVFSIFLIIMLILAIYIPSWSGARKTGFMEGVQGRYLFPLMTLVSYLIVTGINRIFSIFNHVKKQLGCYITLITVVLTMIFLDFTAIFRVLLPYFYGSAKASSYLNLLNTIVNRVSGDWFKIFNPYFYYVLFALYIVISLMVIIKSFLTWRDNPS